MMLDGKKTYIGIAVTALGAFLQYKGVEPAVYMQLIGLVTSIYGRVVAKA